MTDELEDRYRLWIREGAGFVIRGYPELQLLNFLPVERRGSVLRDVTSRLQHFQVAKGD